MLLCRVGLIVGLTVAFIVIVLIIIVVVCVIMHYKNNQVVRMVNSATSARNNANITILHMSQCLCLSVCRIVQKF